MKRSTSIGLVATVATVLASGVAFAHPAGGNFSQTIDPMTITSTNPSTPTILRSVSIKCPVAGFLIANADASFNLDIPGVFGTLAYGISRTTAFDPADVHTIGAPQTTFLSLPGSIQRFDTCTGGQTITYRFVAYRFIGLGTNTTAVQPRLSVIFLRDRI